MKEIKNIVQAFDKATAKGRRCVLATVVHVQGSSYRRAGARMLITDDGQLTGAISGGCLEGDALRKALMALQQQRPLLVTYDTMDEDDAKLGIGLGCNGIVKILMEPIDSNNPNNCIALFKAILSKRQNAVLTTVFIDDKQATSQPGTCLLRLEDEKVHTNLEDEQLKSILKNTSYNALLNKSSSYKNYTIKDKTYNAFIEYMQPGVSLIIFGAGNDTVPLTEMASVLGWQVTVIDGRPGYATPQRFPKAQKTLFAKPFNALQDIAVDAQTVFVLMTHNYNYDIAMLEQLIWQNTSYIGILGPRKKAERMFSELSEKGIFLSPAQSAKIYAPVGLDIGAETAEEIASSIIAEIKKVFASKEGRSLREKLQPIHAT